MKICESERDRNQWPSRYCGGSRAGSDTHAGSQHHTPSPDLELAGEEKERPDSQQLEARH